MSEESKFKVGDKVWVTSIPYNVSEVDAKVGDVGVIIKTDDSGIPYKVKSGSFVNDPNGIWFREENLELVTEQGVKYDSDKLEYSLLPKGVLNSVIKVLGFGSKKYSKDNWMKVDNHKERYYNAAQRHINQWWEGEKYDSETGENHLAHAMCCLMFLLWFDNQEDMSKSVAAKLAKALSKEGSL